MSELKKIVGLDVGTNSIGWAYVSLNLEARKGEIHDLGSRIIPMPADEISNFNQGNLESATSARTAKRGKRRLIERQLKRRERLVDVLKIYGMIPEEWNPNRYSSFAYNYTDGKAEFKFKQAYKEMKAIFESAHPDISVIPNDWTIYYLRKKALEYKISLEELAWVILQFNAKRGYYQLRGDDDLDTADNKFFISDIVDEIVDLDDEVRGKKKFRIVLRDGVEGEFSDKEKPEFIGKRIEFIATEKSTKEGDYISLTKPDGDDWTLRKKRTEHKIAESGKSLGAYIFDRILEEPGIKIRGKEVHTIDRKWYRKELEAILAAQIEFHPELKDEKTYEKAIQHLYNHNESHKKNLRKYGFGHLIATDIIYYQRPLKTKKYLIRNCKFEKYFFKDKNGELESRPVKVTARSNPYFQEFRVWSTLQNLRIIAEERRNEKGELVQDVDVSQEYLHAENIGKLFELFMLKKEVSETQILKELKLDKNAYRINFESQNKLPGNITISSILQPFSKEKKLKKEVLELVRNQNDLHKLWHIIYSLGEDESHMRSGIQTAFPDRLSKDAVDLLLQVPGFDKNYAAFSEKALKKLLPVMRMGKYFDEKEIHSSTKERIEKVINAEFDLSIKDEVREELMNRTEMHQFQGLPLHTASYLVYGRHSEAESDRRFEKPEDIDVDELIPQYSLRNPTAEQVIRETLLLVKKLWEVHGKPDEIHVEMARELKLPNDKRAKYTQRRDENYNTNQRAIAMLNELKADQPSINPHSKGHIETFKIFEEGAHANAGSTADTKIKAIRKKGDPTPKELEKYKLWLEQKYQSPYSKQVIPLSSLFTSSYEIEHVIPKTLFYDDSFNNKIICETELNGFKDNKTAYQMILDAGGTVQNGIRILEREKYEELTKKMYGQNKIKYKNLMRTEPPYDFAQRQLNNTRYISRKLYELLDPFVREEGEEAARSKNLMPMAGGITHELRNDWGLHHIWKKLLAPRFLRMNELTQTDEYYQKNGQRIDLSGYENELKRLDHRHHAVDALTVACTTRQHINYINSRRAENTRYNLRDVLFDKDENGKYQGYRLPWKGFPEEAERSLRQVVVSFKNRIRVINKTINYYQKYIEQADGSFKKKFVRQESNGANWAVRQPLSKETYKGKVILREYKPMSINSAVKDPHLIADPKIRKHMIRLLKKFEDKKSKVKKYLKEKPFQRDGKEIKKLQMIEYNTYATSTMDLDESTTQKHIDKIVDPNLQQELYDHLEKYGGDAELAFSTNGLIDFNSSRKLPVQNVRVKEKFGLKYPVGQTGNKQDKYVESAKTNLFFNVYWNEKKQKREFETISLQEVVLHQMSVAHLSKKERRPVPIDTDKGEFLFYLSPHDLVYVPTKNQIDSYRPKNVELSTLSAERIYKSVSFTNTTALFLPQTVSSIIKDKKEFEAKNKMQKDILGNSIKNNCWKLQVDKLGRIKNIITGPA
jgi:CRISPR-associated endonuclease Csn1